IPALSNQSADETCWSLLLSLIPTAPQPAQRVGQDRAAVHAAMAAGSADKLVVVLFKLQCFRHLLVREPPVAVFVVDVVLAILQEDAERLRIRLANQSGIDMAAADVGEAADMAQHFAK